jgi:hypothetical protein
MTVTATRVNERVGERAVAGRAAVPGLGRPGVRRPGLLVLGIVLMLGSIVAFTALYARAGRQLAVLVAAKDLAPGTRIDPGDLAVARVVPSSAIAGIPATEESTVVGRIARLLIPRGSVLVTSDLAGTATSSSREAVVGVALGLGQLPASGLAPGARVAVVFTGPDGSPLSDAEVAGVGSGASSTTAGTLGPEQGSGPSTPSQGGQSAASEVPLGSAGNASSPPLLPTLLEPGDVVVNDALVVDERVPASDTGAADTTVVSLEVPADTAPVVAAAAAAKQIALVEEAP